ncbi:MAG TPA: hypothetical protein VFE52_05010, partial [Devosia sp.]|nr:hypothetical protein [Devosia sp.]
MSDTINNAGAGRGGSFLSTRVMNTVRYSMMNLFIIFGMVFIAMGGPWTYMGLVFSFFLIGYVDELFGDISDRENMPPIWYCQLMLFATLPLLIFATLIAFNVSSPAGWAWLDWFPRMFGINPDAARDWTHHWM